MNNTIFIFILFFPTPLFSQSEKCIVKAGNATVTYDKSAGGEQSFIISGVNNMPVKQTGFSISVGEPSFIPGNISEGEGFYIGEISISGQTFKTATPMPQNGGKWVYVPDGVELEIKRKKEYEAQPVPVIIKPLK